MTYIVHLESYSFVAMLARSLQWYVFYIGKCTRSSQATYNEQSRLIYTPNNRPDHTVLLSSAWLTDTT